MKTQKNDAIFTVILTLAVLGIIVLLAFANGCANPAANELSKNFLQFNKPLVLDNPNLKQSEKELWLILAMQANGYTDEEISEQIEILKLKGELFIDFGILKASQ